MELEKRKVELENSISALDKRIKILEEKLENKNISKEKEGWYNYQKNWDDHNSYLFHVSDQGIVDKMIVSEYYEQRWENGYGQRGGRSGYKHKGYGLKSDGNIGEIMFINGLLQEYQKESQKIDYLSTPMLQFRALCIDL